MSARGNTTVRVLIADDHRLFAEALAAMLSSEERVSVVGCAGDGREAVELARTLRPDVVLLDIAMPVMDGIEAAQQITREQDAPSVVMVTGSNAAQDVDRARRAGASAYVTKDEIAATLVDSIFGAVGAGARC
jgi:DNA-binding NarL/FixJ family response regulator